MLQTSVMSLKSQQNLLASQKGNLPGKTVKCATQLHQLPMGSPHAGLYGANYPYPVEST